MTTPEQRVHLHSLPLLITNCCSQRGSRPSQTWSRRGNARALLDLNKTEPKYTLRSVTGEYSALNVVSIMYSAFQQFAPGTDLGIDLAREYQMALALRQQSDPSELFSDPLP